MARSGFSWELMVAVTSSVALHALWLAREAKASYAQEAAPAEVFFEPEPLPPPPPPPPAEPEPEPAKAEPVAAAPKPAAKAQAKAEAAPPAAAQAGKTLTAPENDNSSAVADFTMVQGNGSTYAGGTTSALGTSTTAVRGPASDSPAAKPAGTGSAQRPSAPTGPDRSRAAVPEAADWNCSRLFPTDPEAGDQAAVVIAVTVLASGMPKSVVVLRDPGHGFGAAAKACAMGQRFKPALDREGNGVLATTPPITVRFSR